MKNKILLIFALMFPVMAFCDSVALILENDCLFRRTRKNQDQDYTHGTGLEYWYQDTWRFQLQQNMYTPGDITVKEHIVGDRPYAGWLGFAVGRELFQDAESPWTHFVEGRFGMIGPSAKAGETQRWIHKILDCREPRGWDNQLHDEFCVNFEWWTKYNWYMCDYVALIPRVGILAGTLQDATEVGCDLKFGWNIKRRKDIGNNMMFSAVGPEGKTKMMDFLDHVVFYGYVGGDCRYYLYNHFLEGSLFNDKDDGLSVSPKRFVGELQFGAYLEVYGVFVKYYATIRTREFKDQDRAPDYGGLYIGYRWDF